LALFLILSITLGWIQWRTDYVKGVRDGWKVDRYARIEIIVDFPGFWNVFARLPLS
jgi:hypothetical protein